MEHNEVKRGTRAWRICQNPKSNEWNTEPERILVPYTIIAECGDAYLVERNGWHGKKHQHYIRKVEFFFSKDNAVKALSEAL